MATISLCMIAQDEEICIAAGIESCQPYVNEIIILDGGSVDATKEIALSYSKVKFYEFPFDRHFGNQRNRCLAKAKCEWILFKDCDEIFEYDLLISLQRLAEEERFSAFNVFAFGTKTYMDGELINIEEPDYHIRYWKNGQSIHYEGALHEQVVGFEQDKLLNCNLLIIHQKTKAMQLKDNQLYWDMGQKPDPGWIKKEGKWLKDDLEY